MPFDVGGSYNTPPELKPPPNAVGLANQPGAYPILIENINKFGKSTDPAERVKEIAGALDAAGMKADPSTIRTVPIKRSDERLFYNANAVVRLTGDESSY